MLSLLLKIVFSTQVFAGLISSMPSTYKETGIPNSHLVAKNVIRAMAPRNAEDIDNLLKLHVSEFLIFKNQTNDEVDKEIALLEEKGVTSEHIHHYDFPWKDITDFQSICEMTVDALMTIEKSENENHKIFFHCTVGEDRTGYLAGLYKIYRTNQSLEDIFQGELCDKGYEAGNPKKGMNVILKIRESLTPSFLTMVNLIQEVKKDKISLSKSLCKGAEFQTFSRESLQKFRCSKSRLIQ